MGMWFNCTFGLNEAANSACCPANNASHSDAWSYCAIAVGADNGTNARQMTSYKVGDCFARYNVTDIRVYLQDKPEKPSSAVQAQALRPRPLSVLSFVLFTLAFASVTLAQTEQRRPNQNEELAREDNDLHRKYGKLAHTPMCTHFEPDGAHTWKLDATMPPIHYGEGAPAYAAGVDDGTNTDKWLNVTWSSDVPVSGDWGALQDALKKNLPKDRFERLRERVFVPSVPDMFFFPRHPDGPGRMAASSTAVLVPGTFSQCVNVTELTHRGNVSVPDEDGVFFFAASLPPKDSR